MGSSVQDKVPIHVLDSTGTNLMNAAFGYGSPEPTRDRFTGELSTSLGIAASCNPCNWLQKVRELESICMNVEHIRVHDPWDIRFGYHQINPG
jgi:hypothetical protein